MLMLDGIYPPIPTPFDGKGRISEEALKSNLLFLNQFDLRGFVVLGSNGEYVMLSEEEKLLVMETVRTVLPADKLIIAEIHRSSELAKTSGNLVTKILWRYARSLGRFFNFLAVFIGSG